MKTYVVYLSGNEFSVEMTSETITSLKKFNIEYELFDGVIGRDGIAILQSFNANPSIHVSKHDWTDGTIGCLASHYLLWQKCSEQDEPFLILEQDGILLRDPRELLPDIEKICHLDAYLPFDSVKTEAEDHFGYYNDMCMKYEEGTVTYPSSSNFYNNNKVTGSTFRGTYGYIIKPEGAKDILDFIDRHGAFPSDRCLSENATHLQRSACTYVRLNPFFHSLDMQREYSLR